MTLALTVFKKYTFKKVSHLNALDRKFDLTLGCMANRANLTLRSTQDHHLNKFGRPHIPKATYQVPRSSAF